MNRVAAWVASLLALTVAPAAQAQNLVVNGSFEQPVLPDGVWSTFDSIPGWTGTACGIEIQPPNVVTDAFDGRQLVELDSYCPSAMFQEVPTVAGTYLLSLAYRPRPDNGTGDNRVRVLWNGEELATLDGPASLGWAVHSWQVSATGPAVVRLEDVSYDEPSGGYGGLIDDVRVVSAAPDAFAGVDLTRQEGALVQLDGSGSTSALGPLAFRWTQVSGPEVVLAGADGATPTFTAPFVDATVALVFRLEVTDAAGQTDFDEVTVEVANVNEAPVCADARASAPQLWPPSHALVPISIAGVGDPESSAVIVSVLAVTQDEPTDGLGDGDTSPDAALDEAGALSLRAERGGVGDGRVYRVSFRATDSFGESCVGVVTVGVPHDRKGVATDGGDSFDSFASR